MARQGGGSILLEWAGGCAYLKHRSWSQWRQPLRLGWMGEPRLVQSIEYDFLAHLSDAETVPLELGQMQTVTQTINYETRRLMFQYPTSQVIFSRNYHCSQRYALA